MAEEDYKLHIVMFPWLAFGHMIPFLELAKHIAQQGHKITFISTPRNIDRLPRLPPHLAPQTTFISLPLPFIENLPQGAEATSDLLEKDTWYLKKAYDLLQEPLFHFLQSSVPDWILFDFASYWLPTLARELNIPNVYFCACSAASISYVSPPSGEEDYRKDVQDYLVTPKWVPFPSTVSNRLFEVLRLSTNINGEDEKTSDFYRFREVFKRCDIVAIRSCSEFEPEWLKLLQDIHHKPVFPVGVLPPSVNDSNEGDQTAAGGTKWRSMKEWLDMQEKGSVVYVAFGSEAMPSQAEVTDVALGLEQSGLPFIWVLRTQNRSNSAEVKAPKLPNGFEERTKGRGLICTSWAPQLKILAHDSVGGFLTHSGWSSVVEALQFARPLLLLTFFADQGTNAKLLEEKMTGYLIPRNEEEGLFTGDSLAESLRLVIVGEKGKVYREKAMEMKGLFADRDRQNLYVSNFLEYLKTHILVKNHGNEGN